MTEAATNQTAKNVNTAAANWRKPNKDELNLLGNFLSRNQIKLVSFNDDEEEEEAWDDPSMVVWDDEEEEWNEETDDSLGMLIRKVHPDGSPID